MIFPGSPSGAVDGAEVEAEVVLDLEFELALEADLGFCAQGGRSDWASLKVLETRSSAMSASCGVE